MSLLEEARAASGPGRSESPFCLAMEWANQQKSALRKEVLEAYTAPRITVSTQALHDVLVRKYDVKFSVSTLGAHRSNRCRCPKNWATMGAVEAAGVK